MYQYLWSKSLPLPLIRVFLHPIADTRHRPRPGDFADARQLPAVRRRVAGGNEAGRYHRACQHCVARATVGAQSTRGGGATGHLRHAAQVSIRCLVIIALVMIAFVFTSPHIT